MSLWCGNMTAFLTAPQRLRPILVGNMFPLTLYLWVTLLVVRRKTSLFQFCMNHLTHCNLISSSMRGLCCTGKPHQMCQGKKSLWYKWTAIHKADHNWGLQQRGCLYIKCPSSQSSDSFFPADLGERDWSKKRRLKRDSVVSSLVKHSFIWGVIWPKFKSDKTTAMLLKGLVPTQLVKIGREEKPLLPKDCWRCWGWAFPQTKSLSQKKKKNSSGQIQL